MGENKSLEKIKYFAKRKWNNFVDWFTEKEIPQLAVVGSFNSS